jgi:hypothetical protein
LKVAITKFIRDETIIIITIIHHHHQDHHYHLSLQSRARDIPSHDCMIIPDRAPQVGSYPILPPDDDDEDATDNEVTLIRPLQRDTSAVVMTSTRFVVEAQLARWHG